MRGPVDPSDEASLRRANAYREIMLGSVLIGDEAIDLNALLGALATLTGEALARVGDEHRKGLHGEVIEVIQSSMARTLKNGVTIAVLLDEGSIVSSLEGHA